MNERICKNCGNYTPNELPGNSGKWLDGNCKEKNKTVSKGFTCEDFTDIEIFEALYIIQCRCQTGLAVKVGVLNRCPACQATFKIDRVEKSSSRIVTPQSPGRGFPHG